MSFNDADRELLQQVAALLEASPAPQSFTPSDRETLAVIQTALANIGEQQRHHAWLLQAILTNTEHIMAALDDFITSMTQKMSAQTTEIAGLKTFVQSMFDQIRAGVPSITQEQQTALDAIQAATDRSAAGIAAAMLDTGGPAPAQPSP